MRRAFVQQLYGCVSDVFRPKAVEAWGAVTEYLFGARLEQDVITDHRCV